MTQMKTAVYIFIGGGLGSVCRYAVGQASTRITAVPFPFGTLIANFLASILLGFVMGKLLLADNTTLKVLVAIGFCGGFSTFSTFSYDTFKLFIEGRSGEALVNIFLNVSSCLLAIYLGLQLTK